MGDFLLQPPVIVMLAFIVICIILMVGIIALLRSSRAKQQASKKAAIQAEMQPPVSRPQVQAPTPKPTSTFDMLDSIESDDDPLADLYADNEEVDLGSLLSGMGEEKVHTVATGQVNVRLETGSSDKNVCRVARHGFSQYALCRR